jgi:phage tail-like protein
MASDDRKDPFRVPNFEIAIDKIQAGAFSECSGLTTETEATDYREGTAQTPFPKKLMALGKVAPVVLKRGYTKDTQLWDWYAAILKGNPDRRNVTITLRNERYQPVIRWHLDSAWIRKIEGPSLKATGNEVAMESVEIVHEGLHIEPVSGAA